MTKHFCAAIFVSAWTAMTCFAQTTDPGAIEAISKHQESLNRIKSYHLKFELHNGELDEPDAPLRHDEDLEIWSEGSRHRSLKRLYFSLSPAGVTDYGPQGEVWDSSIDERQSRSMNGWDAEHPYPLPLEWGRSISEFQSVQCMIEFFDPKAFDAVLAPERAYLSWELRPGWSLERMTEVCEFVVVPQDNASLTRLKIASTTLPDEFAAGLVQVGTTLDLDHEHGWLVSRIESRQDAGIAVREVVEFREGAPGLWYPHETRSTWDGRPLQVTKVLHGEFNAPLDPELLQTQFPEGARVGENPDGKIHIWGKSEPVATFANSEQLLTYLHARARDYQQPKGEPLTPATGSAGRTILVLANVGLIVLLGVLFVARRLLMRR